MKILGIETSCDETSVAIVEGKKNYVELKANVVATSLAEHAKTGGVIPEVAARAQLKFMLPVLQEALEKGLGYSPADLTIKPPPVDAIAVTYGPGLIGPLLIGVETARTLSYVWNKPVVPVNHMLGHIYANFVRENEKLKTKNEKDEIGIEFPLLALVVSGGHSDLIYMKGHGDYRVLGGTRDDAAGEAFDKIGRLLGLPYPAGPVIEERAKAGDKKRFKFPRPLLGEKNYDFSFSGLKTAVWRETNNLRNQTIMGLPRSPDLNGIARNDIQLNEQTINDIAAGTQAAVIDVLVKKTLRAAEETDVKSIVLSGGVAANKMLRETMQSEIERQKIGAKLFVPTRSLCTDNGVMIAAAAYFNYSPIDWRKLTANPELYYE